MKLTEEANRLEDELKRYAQQLEDLKDMGEKSKDEQRREYLRIIQQQKEEIQKMKQRHSSEVDDLSS